VQPQDSYFRHVLQIASVNLQAMVAYLQMLREIDLNPDLQPVHTAPWCCPL
jgi:hypothetical protein